jgi:hypothetical protein
LNIQNSTNNGYNNITVRLFIMFYNYNFIPQTILYDERVTYPNVVSYVTKMIMYVDLMLSMKVTFVNCYEARNVLPRSYCVPVSEYHWLELMTRVSKPSPCSSIRISSGYGYLVSIVRVIGQCRQHHHLCGRQFKRLSTALVSQSGCERGEAKSSC